MKMIAWTLARRHASVRPAAIVLQFVGADAHRRMTAEQSVLANEWAIA
jgi:hypothetical protein